MKPALIQTTIKLSLTTELLATAALTCRATGFTLDRLLAKGMMDVSANCGIYDRGKGAISDYSTPDIIVLNAVMADKNFDTSWTICGVEYEDLGVEGRSALHSYCNEVHLSIEEALYFINECLLSLDVRNLYVLNKTFKEDK